MKSYGLILAAGKGTRMKDDLPKVAQKILGKEFINYVYDSMSKAGIEEIYPIVGYKRDIVLACRDFKKHFVQEEQLGTGHAVMQAKEYLLDKKGLCLVMAGDQPLISEGSIKSLIDYHNSRENDLTLLTAISPNPFGYGRIIKRGSQIIKIVEERDGTETEKKIEEVNISVYCFDNQKLFEHINELDNCNSQGELYITDLINIFNERGLRVESVLAKTFEETIGISDKRDLAIATKTIQNMINEYHMENGVTIVDPFNTYIGPDVKILEGTTIYPNSIIEGSVRIGKDCVIKSSYITNSVIGDRVTIGPFAHIRMKSELGNDIRLGNFVEVKKSKLDDGTKSAHLTYLGDSEIGKKVNIGCGTITVNYDGKSKYKTIIEDGAFIGSNVNLIAPIKVGKNSVIAAGSTIKKDVPEDSLAIAREREIIKKDYYKE